MGAPSPALLWFVSRGSGLVLFAVLSAVVTLGIAERTRLRWRVLPGFGVVTLHRTLALFALVLLPLHVLSALLDPYVHLGWWALIVPFSSPYRRAAIALGTLSLDLLLAVIATSLLRTRLGERAWRVVHLSAYLLWPLALAHTLRAGADLSTPLGAVLEWGSVCAVLTAFVARLIAAVRGETRRAPRRRPARMRP
jgi:sulfoxide reductase heme-binding subunit YedZ